MMQAPPYVMFERKLRGTKTNVQVGNGVVILQAMVNLAPVVVATFAEWLALSNEINAEIARQEESDE